MPEGTDRPHPVHAVPPGASQAPAASGGNKPAFWSLHLWQIQPVRDAMLIAAVFGIIYLGYKLSVVTVPILLAMLLAYLIEPLVKFVTPPRHKWFTRRGFALLLIFSTFLLIVIPAGIGLTYGVMQGADYAGKLSKNIQTTVASVEKPDDPKLQKDVENLGPAWSDIRRQFLKLRAEHLRQQAIDKGEAAPDTAPDKVGATIYRLGTQVADWVKENADQIGKQVLSSGGSAAAFIASLAGSVFHLGFTLFLTAFFFYFFCTGWGGVLGFWQSLIPEKKKHRTLELLSKMDAVIAGFIRGRLTICFLLMGWFALGYWLVGVPVPLLMALLAGVLSLAPYVQWGAILLAAFLMSLSVGGPGGPLGAWEANWWWAIAGPISVHAVGQLIDDYILTPKIQGDKTGMDVPTILFASLAGGILAGFYGLLLAIPVGACIKILLREVVWPRIKAWADGRAHDPLPVADAKRG
ncbi:MAG: AI-2E family transporter [Phycisphaerales bacterium]